MTSETLPLRWCAAASRACGEDPIGMAGTFDRYIFIERPTPWPADLWRIDQLPPALAALSKVPEWIRRAAARGRRVRLLALAPDEEYSCPGQTRVLAFQRPVGPFAVYDRHEFLAPDEAASDLIEALMLEDVPLDDAGQCAAYWLAPARPPREFMVCTHGTVDACCARLGYPAYRTLRHELAPALGEALRVWRVSHFGGHRLAPTLIDWPEGRWWGHLDREALSALARRDVTPAALRRCYRGWGGLSFFGQVVERELLCRHGWEWTTYRVSERLLEVDGVPADCVAELPAYPQFGDQAPRAARVRLTYDTPAGAGGAYEAAIERCDMIEIVGECGARDEETREQGTTVRRTRAGQYGVTEISAGAPAGCSSSTPISLAQRSVAEISATALAECAPGERLARGGRPPTARPLTRPPGTDRADSNAGAAARGGRRGRIRSLGRRP